MNDLYTTSDILAYAITHNILEEFLDALPPQDSTHAYTYDEAKDEALREAFEMWSQTHFLDNSPQDEFGIEVLSGDEFHTKLSPQQQEHIAQCEVERFFIEYRYDDNAVFYLPHWFNPTYKDALEALDRVKPGSIATALGAVA